MKKQNKTIPNPGSDAAIKQNISNEVWKPVVGYAGKYEVSNIGNVRSLNWGGSCGKIHNLTKTISKGPHNKVGYYVVRLHTASTTKVFYVGRLVLSAFVRLPEVNEEHNHINGNTLDNTTQNLEWLTSSDNHKHAIKTGLAKPPPTKNPLNSGRKYWWQHEDGTYLLKTCSEMGRFVNASNAPFFKMVSGKPQNHRSFRGWALAKIYPPGSKEAMENLCACAIIDNHCGAGIDGKGKQFWINEACPLHANKN